MSSPAPATPVSHRSLDELEDDIVSLAQHINAAEYEFLALVREFEIRQGWKAWHFNSCAEWLNFKCGMALGTAREKVRVAMALCSERTMHVSSRGRCMLTAA